jgi:hypothetical protein
VKTEDDPSRHQRRISLSLLPGGRAEKNKGVRAPEEKIPHPLIQGDAFADRPFAGKPVVIYLLKDPAEEGWMHALAQEMNLSETAYVYPVEEGFNLRWVTPAAEVDLCGEGARCWFSRPSCGGPAPCTADPLPL